MKRSTYWSTRKGLHLHNCLVYLVYPQLLINDIHHITSFLLVVKLRSYLSQEKKTVPVLVYSSREHFLKWIYVKIYILIHKFRVSKWSLYRKNETIRLWKVVLKINSKTMDFVFFLNDTVLLLKKNSTCAFNFI